MNEYDNSIVCAVYGKPICRSEKTIGLLAMHYKLNSHQKTVDSILGGG